MQNLTVVTGVWNIGRDAAGEGFRRPFTHYLDKLKELLHTNVNMVVYIEKEYEDVVWAIRRPENTRVVIKEVSEFTSGFDAYQKVQDIRTNPEWLNQAEWLGRSTQATLPLYNPLVMSKYFMLHDQACTNPFNTDYFVWIDGGITSTVHPGYFTHDKVLEKLVACLDPFLFVSFPYIGSTEIHGFKREGMNKYCNTEYVEYVCRGGIFGGRREVIRKFNSNYYRLLSNTMSEGYMGTEESIFTILAHQFPTVFNRAVINGDGLVTTFFEALKNNTVTLSIPQNTVVPDIAKLKCYVLAFNSPKQFDVLCESWAVDPLFSTLDKVLVDNSTNAEVEPEYIRLCEKWNFTRVKHDNIGICGGRQWVAEDFDRSDYDGYIFLEDDMLLNNTPGICSNGFTTKVDNLIAKARHLLFTYHYDFVKFSYTEFFGDNGTQWSWYNVPQHIREQFFPRHTKLPVQGLDPNAPRVTYNNIRSYEGTSCIDGEVYYCNWPQIVSRVGNKKMFLDTTWARPYEQTWMSHMFQLTKAGELKGALLLASPITHNRFEHYAKGQRKES